MMRVLVTGAAAGIGLATARALGAAFAAMDETFGGIDILVNNEGITGNCSAETLDLRRETSQRRRVECASRNVCRRTRDRCHLGRREGGARYRLAGFAVRPPQAQGQLSGICGWSCCSLTGHPSISLSSLHDNAATGCGAPTADRPSGAREFGKAFANA